MLSCKGLKTVSLKFLYEYRSNLVIKLQKFLLFFLSNKIDVVKFFSKLLSSCALKWCFITLFEYIVYKFVCVFKNCKNEKNLKFNKKMSIQVNGNISCV